MKLHWTLLLIAVAACGKVQAAADAAVDTGLADALSCPATQQACGSACSDLQSSITDCGACGISCQSDRETCMAGHCVDFGASCATIQAASPTAESGPYTLLDQTTVFCDFAHNVTYTGLAYGQYDVAHPGFAMVSAADLQDPVLQKAFIFLYNRQHGLTLIAAWTDTNCCFKADMIANNSNMMFLHGANITPASAADSGVCNVVHNDSPAHFLLSATGAASGMTLADDFFVTNPATAGTGCTASANPAFFWVRKPSS